MYTIKVKPWAYIVLGMVGAVIVAVIWGYVQRQDVIAPTVNQPVNINQPNTNSPANTNTATTAVFSTADLPDRDPKLSFIATIPASWVAEYVAGSQAINFYDPKGTADSTLEKSQIFVKYFEASKFLTLTTVTIKSRTETTVNGRPTVTYIIEKKIGVADFPSQPSWRNREHRVTDIRSTNASPTLFYVFAKAPDVTDAVFDQFLTSVTFGEKTVTSNVVYPLIGFVSRITKKPFGIHITPSTSPVQPERFSGWHSGADAEVTADEVGHDVPVYAIAAGTIRLARVADGYGGIMIVEHTIGSETVSAVYGHVRLSSIKKAVGDVVASAEQMAVLGRGGTEETDGERQHLHFGLLPGRSTNLQGYASRERGLTAWLNPLDWLSQQGATAPRST